MKKILNVFLAGTVALGFASCDKNKTNDEPVNEASKTSVRLLVGEAGARAITDGQAGDGVVGATGESEVAKGWFMTRSAHGDVSLAEVTTFSATADKESMWASTPFVYTGSTGKVNAALVLNQPTEYTNFKDDVIVPISDLKEVAKSGKFTMSSKTTQEITITSGVTEEEAKASTNPKNNFDFTVERLASKVQVSMPNGGVKVGGNLKDKATFEDLSYSVAGSAKKIYLFGDNAGERQLKEDATYGAIYNGFKSAIHELPITTYKVENGIIRRDVERAVTKVSQGLLVTLDASATDFPKLQSLKIEKEATVDAYKNTSSEKGIFFYENSLPENTTELNYNDITHVKFYGKMKIVDGKEVVVIKGLNPEVQASSADLEAEHTSVVYVTKAYKDAFDLTHNTNVTFEDTSDKQDKEGHELFKMTIVEKPGTFYVGADGKMYLTLEVSRAAGNKTSKKYTEGKMVWKTPANSQKVGADVKYADTRRNNIYSLSLTDINGIGKNYDPVDPKDPNIKKPTDNPDEPVVDEKDPVNEVKTYIKVKATILKWNLVHRGVVLD